MKIFVSHSSRNTNYGEALVQLLVDIGIPHEAIIFTSDSMYGIPSGENIFNWLKDKISEKPFVIYLLSREYFSSVACLNEMGAAWMIESEHVSIFIPGFDIESSEFRSGALDPREMGFFIDDDDRVFEFTERLRSKFRLATGPLPMDRARKKFGQAVSKLPAVKNPRPTANFVGAKASESKKPDSKLFRSEVGLKSSDVPAPVPSKSPSPVERFFDDLRSGKLKDEEVMVIQYAEETARFKLGVGWRTAEEVERIRDWEEMNEVGSVLSRKYDTAIKRLDLRKLTTVSERTSTGNPREVELIPEMQQKLLDLPDEFHAKFVEVVKMERERIESSSNDDIPF